MSTWKENNWIKKLKEEYDLDGLYTGGTPQILVGVKDIDGFKVSTEGTYTPEPEALYKRYLQFNKKYFEDKLPHLTIPQFKVRNVSKWVGLTEARVLRENKYSNKLKWAIIVAISVSTRYARSELVYLTTLLHEMIHVYQYSVLSIRADHSYTFLNKMKEINSFGWKVNVTESDEEVEQRGNIDHSVLDKICSTKYLGVVKQKSGRLMAFIFPKKNIGLFEDKLQLLHYPDGSAQVYEILDATPFTDWTSTTMKGSLSGYGITEDKVKELKNKEMIRDYWDNKDFNESVERKHKIEDPMIQSNILKEYPDGSIIEEVTII